MGSIDLREKHYLLVRRKDIIDKIRTSITDGEIIEDIINNVEQQVVKRCSNLSRVTIPFIGSFVPNEGKLDAIEHHGMMKDKRKSMTKEEYEKFKREFIFTRFKIRRGYRSKAIIISRTARLNKKRAERKLRKYGNDELSYKLSQLLFAYMSPVKSAKDYINEYENSKEYDL